jgi:hypothetical protein
MKSAKMMPDHLCFIESGLPSDILDYFWVYAYAVGPSPLLGPLGPHAVPA